MKSEEIDDILSNINGNEETSSSHDSLTKIQKSAIPAKISLEQILKNKKDDFLYLDDNDSGKIIEDNEDDIIKKNPANELNVLNAESQENTKQSEDKKNIIKEEKVEEYITKELIVKGTKSWNTREPYIILIDNKKIKTDNDDLDHTFYFIETENKSTSIGEMKRAVIKYLQGTKEKILNRYSAFISNQISFYLYDLSNDFGFQEEKSYLFLYHLGILTIYKIIINELKINKLGYCFKILPDNDNNIVKFFPSEFIKEKVILWHNDIFNNSDIPFDTLVEYNDIQRRISSHYLEDLEKNKDKFDIMIANSNQQNVTGPEREELLRRKWDMLFGHRNILVYNRFLERTIFKSTR